MAGFDPLASSQVAVDPPLIPKSGSGAKARMAQLIAAGFTPDEAMGIVQDEVQMYGEGGQYGVARAAAAGDNPVDNEARAQRVAGLRRKEAQQLGFEQQMADVYASPQGDASDVDAILGRQMDPDGQYRRVGRMGPVAPGPQQKIAMEEAKLNKAAAKRREENAAAMAARQQWEEQNPDMAADRKSDAKDNLADYKRERALFRAARRQGVSVENVVAQAPEQWGSVGGRQPLNPLPGQEDQIFTPKGTRFADENARIADENARKAAWRAQTMLAGSNPQKNVVNALGMLSPEHRAASMRYMLPGGQLAAQVDARQLQAAAALAQRAVTGALAGSAQGPMAQAQAAILGLQAQAERDKLRSGDEDVLGEKYAPGQQNWLPGWLGGGYDEFTEDEQGQMYDDLIAQGYSDAEAKRAVDRQAQKRRATKRKQWSNKGA